MRDLGRRSWAPVDEDLVELCLPGVHQGLRSLCRTTALPVASECRGLDGLVREQSLGARQCLHKQGRQGWPLEWAAVKGRRE